jgi:hypothetical protein
MRKTGYDVSNLHGRLSRESQVIAKSKEILTFWQLVGGFLDYIQVPTTSAIVSTPVELKDILAVLPA